MTAVSPTVARNTGHLVDGGQEANINECIRNILTNLDSYRLCQVEQQLHGAALVFFLTLHDIFKDIFNLFRVDHSTEETVTFALQTPDRIKRPYGKALCPCTSNEIFL